MDVRTSSPTRSVKKPAAHTARHASAHCSAMPRSLQQRIAHSVAEPHPARRCTMPRPYLAIAIISIAAALGATVLFGSSHPALAEEALDTMSITMRIDGFDEELPVLHEGTDFTAGQAVRSDPRFMVDSQGNQLLAPLIEEKERQGYELAWHTDTGQEFDWFDTPITRSLTVIGTFQEADCRIRVSFNDGSTEDIEVAVPKGSSFEEAYGSIPRAPSKDGYSFVAWIDAATGQPFDFSASVDASTSVYARYAIDEPDRVVVVDSDTDIPQTLTGRCYIGATWSVHPAQFSISGFTGELEGCSGTGSCSLPSAAAPSYTWADYTATLAKVDVEAGIVTYDVTITPPGAAHAGGPSNSLGLIGYQTVYFRAEVQKNFGGYIEVQKKSANPDLSDNDTYSLAGALFGIYDKNGQRVGELVTDAEGRTGRSNILPAGTYTLKEERAPQGYAAAADKSVSVEAGALTQTTISDIPQSALVDLLLQKQDEETGLSYPLGAASLEHARFCVDYHDAFLSVPELVRTAIRQLESGDDSETPALEGWGEPKRSWIFESDETGAIAFDEDHLVEGDDFYRDHEGAIVFPLGTIVIEEIEAPEGYLLLEDPLVITVPEQGSDAHVDAWQCASVPEQVKRGDISFTKTRAGSMGRLAGVPFRITSETTGEAHTILTDDNGMASTHASWTPHSQNTNQGTSWQDGIWFGMDSQGTAAPVRDDAGALPYDTYTIEELRCDANDGMALSAFEVTISRDSTTLDLGTIDNDPFTPEITGEVDKRQTLIDDDGAFAYTIDYRSTSSTWVDEFSVIDHIACAEDGQARLVSLTTPVSFEDYDGSMNVWYRTNAPSEENTSPADEVPDEEHDEAALNNHDGDAASKPVADACATNPYNPDNPHNERQYTFEGWHLWQENVSTLAAQTLFTDDLPLGEGEWVTDIAFEHGRVEEGFTTLPNGDDQWQRRDRYTEADTIDVLAERTCSFDTAQASGKTHTDVSAQHVYAPAILHMQAVPETLDGETDDLYNDVDVELYRNIDLHGADHDTVKQTVARPANHLEKAIGNLPRTSDPLPGAIIMLIALASAAIAAVSCKIHTDAQKEARNNRLTAALRKRK